MANVYSTRFLDQPAVTSEVAYTIPSGFVAIVRCVTFYVLSGLGSATQVGIGGGSIFSAIATGVLSDGESLSQDLRVVVNEGEQIVAAGDGAADVTVSGYLLSLP